MRYQVGLQIAARSLSGIRGKKNQGHSKGWVVSVHREISSSDRMGFQTCFHGSR
jgi:hypothetical protein